MDGGELGEILLPKGERFNEERELVDVFIYRDSEDLPIATQKSPKTSPGNFGVLRVLASNNTGAFLDWGLSKDLLLPYSEQRSSPKIGQLVVVYVYLDPKSRATCSLPTNFPASFQPIPQTILMALKSI